MVIRKPVKRARTLFSDVVKGNDPHCLTNEVQNSNTNDYPRVNSQHSLKHDPRSQLNNKKKQKISAKKTLGGKKGNLTDMSMYKEVSIKHMLFGGEITCLKKFYTGGSNMKVGCSWAQFKGNHIDAFEDDHRAGTTYMIFNNIKDANNLMSTKLVYNDKPIDLYQTVKIEEDITVVNIPNFRDVGIEPMAKLILKELGPWCEIKDISAWRRFDINQYLPYGIKVLVKKNNIEIDLPSFLDHENGKINIFYKGCKEACSYCKEAGHWKSKCHKIKKNQIKKNARENMQKLKFSFNCSNAEAPPVSAAPRTDDSKSVTIEAQPSTKPVEKSKIINDTEVSTNDEAETAKPGTINRLSGTVGLKKPPASSLNAAVISPSSNEKVSSGDDTESDGSDDDNHQPITKYQLNPLLIVMISRISQ
ncbi:hypothetical protein AYI70_g11107 [Smittium culicis]|uniref:CCHC-type domain-containing protein n=1 Tax=Smittium culicis TaxID=133412 RepID=A0A1R1X3B1_9FUNG|nr:hypothetical protein AYI70_g11107 [Smittium culicis]